MRLVAFLKTGPTSHPYGMWWHPETDNDFPDPAWYRHVARVLEMAVDGWHDGPMVGQRTMG